MCFQLFITIYLKVCLRAIWDNFGGYFIVELYFSGLRLLWLTMLCYWTWPVWRETVTWRSSSVHWWTWLPSLQWSSLSESMLLFTEFSYQKDIRLLTVYWYSDRIFLRWGLEARFYSVDIWVFPHSCRCQRRIPLLVFFVIGGVACIIAGIIPFICKTTNCTYFSFTNTCTSIIIYIGYIFIVVILFQFFWGFFHVAKSLEISFS